MIVGLPLNDDPTQAKKVRRFVRKLRQPVRGVRWRFVDETLSTFAARDKFQTAGLKVARSVVDASAAAVILETYLANPD